MRKLFRKSALLIFFLAFFFFSCSSTLLVKSDYISSKRHLIYNDPSQALQAFPKGEKGSFITTLERTYLKLLNGDPDIDELIKYSKLVDKRVRFQASREIKTFFYMETPEGYYASEHEIVWLHILLSWGYSLRGEKEKSYVETKIASNLLSTNWSDEGRFDDPFLRIIIATLWLMNDSWEEAKVDFRVAYELDKSQKWILKLLELEKPPENFILVLGGVGPEPEWDPNVKLNPLRGIRGVKFYYLSKKSSLTLSDSSQKEISMFITPDSKNWYTRHQIRDNEIQDLIQDSKYGQLMLASTLKATGKSTLGIVGGIAIGTLGSALGAGIAYLGLETQTIELILFGIALIPVSISAGYKTASRHVNESIRDAKEELDTSKYYRYVRFLPDYAWVGFNDSLSPPIKIKKNGRVILEVPQTNKQKNVFILHYSDVLY